VTVGDIWQIYIPGVFIVAGFSLLLRWAVNISRRVRRLAERIAYLEAKVEIPKGTDE
jgi:hypothetical protein